MAIRNRFSWGILLLFLVLDSSLAVSIPPSLRSSFPSAIADLKEAVVQGLGTPENGVELSGFDPRDAKIGQSIAYEFHVEIDGKVIPIKLLEDVSRWEFVDFPSISTSGEIALTETDNYRDSRVLPVLAPFQLSGPIELWIQDGDDVRLALPHDVEAGVLKKVVLSDGAKVTVTGAKRVALRHPIVLPLPLNRTHRYAASGLLTMAAALRRASRSKDRPLLSLQIVGPSSLSSSSTPAAPTERLRLKRLAPGLVELSAAAVPTVAGPPFLWPLSSLNGSDSNLRGLEELLAAVLGKRGEETGYFRLLKAEVSATTYVKLGFSVNRLVSSMDVDWSTFPSWKTKPEMIRTRFEVLARVVDDGKIVPERIAEIPPVHVIDPPAVAGNFSASRQPIHHPPPDFFTI